MALDPGFRRDERRLLLRFEQKIGQCHHRVMAFYVYIFASKRNGTLYAGSTDDLPRRAFEHREGLVSGFTKKYAVKHLVWYEIHASRLSAVTRERQIKEWHRAWKLKLIEEINPQWRDLFDELI